MNIDTLIFAKWIIPVEPKETVYKDYALAIKNNKIIEDRKKAPSLRM